MKRLVLSLFIVGIAMSFNSAKAQNATGNASDNGVPLTSPPPQASVGINAVSAPVTVPAPPPVVTIAPVAAGAVPATAAPAVPAAPTPPAAPPPGTPPPAATFTTTLNLPVVAVPVTVPLPALPDVRVPVTSQN